MTSLGWPLRELFVMVNKSYVIFFTFSRGNRVLTRKREWNTYGDPPNSDLLRRYGHVDQVPLANGGLGNPADIVEIPADHLIHSIQHKLPQQTAPWTKERVDWWLDQGGDECIHSHPTLTLLILLSSLFFLDYSNEIPAEMTSFVRLMVMSAPEWEKTKTKSKLPKPKVDDAVLSVVADVVKRRLSDYPTTIEAGFPWVELSSFSTLRFSARRGSARIRKGDAHCVESEERGSSTTRRKAHLARPAASRHCSDGRQPERVSAWW